MIRYGYLTKDYYRDHPNLLKILDVDEESKHNMRTHLCLNVSYNGYEILIPLRHNLGEEKRAYGRIGFSAPTQSKPTAGLDYRYMMIVDDSKYIRFDKPRIPYKQAELIKMNYERIEEQALEYINAYIKVAQKNRVKYKARFRESSLINFHKELGIE